MDIKEKISEIVEKIMSDKALQKQFEKEPVKAIEKLIGMDLPDDVVDQYHQLSWWFVLRL